MDLWYGEWLINAGLLAVIQWGSKHPFVCSKWKEVMRWYGHDIDVIRCQIEFHVILYCYVIIPRHWQRRCPLVRFQKSPYATLPDMFKGYFGEFIVSLSESEDFWLVQRLISNVWGFQKGKTTMYPTATWVLLLSRIFEQAWADRAFIIPVPENLRPMNQCTKLITLNEVQSLSVSPPEGARRHSSFCTGNI